MSVLLPSSTDPAVAMRRRSMLEIPLALAVFHRCLGGPVISPRRAAPRSEMRVVSVSAITASGVAASDGTAAVEVMSPTVRKRTLRTTTRLATQRLHHRR